MLKKNDFKHVPQHTTTSFWKNFKGFMQLPLGQSGQYKILKIHCTLQPGRMVLPGISGKIYVGRMTQEILKDEPWGSEVRDTKDPKHVTCQQKQRYWQLRGDWHQSTAPPGAPATSTGLDIQKENPCNTSCHCGLTGLLRLHSSLNRKPQLPRILEVITRWPEGENFGLSSEEKVKKVTHTKETQP